MTDAEPTLTQSFVKAVKYRMVDLGLNGRTLCEKAGVAPSYWSEISSGKKEASSVAMQKICDAVGLVPSFTATTP